MKTFPVKIKINVPMNGFRAGQVITVQADEYGVFIDRFWRKRLRDSERDYCIEIVNEISQPEKTKKVEQKNDNKNASV